MYHHIGKNSTYPQDFYSFLLCTYMLMLFMCHVHVSYSYFVCLVNLYMLNLTVCKTGPLIPLCCNIFVPLCNLVNLIYFCVLMIENYIVCRWTSIHCTEIAFKDCLFLYGNKLSIAWSHGNVIDCQKTAVRKQNVSFLISW